MNLTENICNSIKQKVIKKPLTYDESNRKHLQKLEITNCESYDLQPCF